MDMRPKTGNMLTRRQLMRAAVLLPIMPLLHSTAAASTPASTDVRPAAIVDVDRIVDLCQVERHRFADGYADFYAVGPNYAAQKRDSITKLIDGGDGLALVHETNGQVDGVILGILVFAPPVYKPPGKVCLLLDFVAPAWSQPAANLLVAANRRVKDLGGVLFIAECMGSAKGKRHFLTTAGFEVASAWYQRFIDIPEPKKAVGGVIEAATTDDIPAIVELCEMRLLQKQKYQPTFWLKADDSAEKQSSYLSWLMSQGKSIMLVHRVGGKIDGLVIANPFGRLPYGEG